MRLDEANDKDTSERDHYFALDLYKLMWIDAWHTEYGWTEAQVTDLNLNRALVHFKGFDQSHDEWISRSSNRFARLHSHTRQPDANCMFNHVVGDEIQVLDAQGVWRSATVIDIAAQLVLIHYVNCPDIENEWIDQANYRISSSNSMAALVAANTNFIDHSRDDKPIAPDSNFEATSAHEEQFRRHLIQSLSCLIVEMAGDGNCLFRSISYAVYGSADHHILIRQACMTYIESEAEFFSAFIEGNTDEFNAYVCRMRRCGEWGDHVEIQAMSEIYNRPVLVYAYAAEPMRTYHEASSMADPIRLSYHFRSHYNAVVPQEHMTSSNLFSQVQPGIIEEQALRISRARASSTAAAVLSSEINFTDAQLFRAAIDESRESFQREDSQVFERAVQDSINEQQRLLDNEAAQQSLNELNETEMRRGLDQSVDHDVNQAIAASLQDEHVNNALVEAALQQSAQESLRLLPEAVRRCHEVSQLPIQLCVQAFSRFEPSQLAQMPLDMVVQDMMDWLLDTC